MKIQKDFAPITIRIETAQDLNDLLQMMYAAIRHELNWARNETTLSEKCKVFIKDLQR